MPNFVQGTGQDVRFALRQMRRSPGFVLTAVLTLALGIGATATIFTLVYQVILRSLPVSHPEQLYKLGADFGCCSTSGVQTPDWSLYSYDLYTALLGETQGVTGMGAVSAREFPVTVRRAETSGSPQTLSMEYVSGNYLGMLGVKPFAGRLLQANDDREGAAPAAVMSYSLWQGKFASDPRVVGSTLLLGGHPVTVVGIAAADFLSERNENDPSGLWVPLTLEPTLDADQQLLKQTDMHWLDVLVRIPRAQSVPAVQQEISGHIKQWVHAHPISAQGVSADDVNKIETHIISAHGGINNLKQDYEHNLNLLLLLAGFVLLIACANLANLLLVRGMARQGELAVRSAMGAPRLRLIRQTLLEALLLALIGGVLAVGVAYLGAHAILALAFPGAKASPLSAAPSWPLLGFAFLVSIVTGVLFGITPAVLTSRLAPVQVLRGANRTTGDASALPQRILVIFQAALSLALLSTAGLLITGLRNLQHQNFHFEPQGKISMAIDLQAAGYTGDRLPGLYTQLDSRIAALPSVERFAYATYGPMSGSTWRTGVTLPGTDRGQAAAYLSVSADYFNTLGIHALAGRTFNTGDTATSAQVVVINKAFADKYLPHKAPVGLRFGPNAPGKGSEWEVVGVVENTTYDNSLTEVEPTFYRPITQFTHYADSQSTVVESAVHFPQGIFVQYRGDSATAVNEIRRVLQSINPDIAILNSRTYTEQVSNTFTQQQLVVRLTSIFGLIALTLASVGLYGVTAYSVARRTGEIGVRMALGASRSNVLKLVLRGALTQTLIGLAIGLPLSFIAGRLLQHSLYQTSAFQPLVLLAVTVMLFAAAVGAALVPAQRAAGLDPMRALRTE